MREFALACGSTVCSHTRAQTMRWHTVNKTTLFPTCTRFTFETFAVSFCVTSQWPFPDWSPGYHCHTWDQYSGHIRILFTSAADNTILLNRPLLTLLIFYDMIWYLCLIKSLYFLTWLHVNVLQSHLLDLSGTNGTSLLLPCMFRRPGTVHWLSVVTLCTEVSYLDANTAWMAEHLPLHCSIHHGTKTSAG